VAARRRGKQKQKKAFFFFFPSGFTLQAPPITVHSIFSQSAPSSSSIDFHFSTLSRSTLSLSTLRSLPTSQPLSPSLCCAADVALPLSLSSADVAYSTGMLIFEKNCL
jgi:hypothetical protein